MSVQRLISVVRHSQQASRVNAAIEGPRRIFEIRTEAKIKRQQEPARWRGFALPRVPSRRDCVYNRCLPARSSHSCVNVAFGTGGFARVARCALDSITLDWQAG